MPFIVGQQLLRRDGNVGMVTVTLTGPNLLHGLPAGRSARICKIVAYNNSGAPAVLNLAPFPESAQPAGQPELSPGGSQERACSRSAWKNRLQAGSYPHEGN